MRSSSHFVRASTSYVGTLHVDRQGAIILGVDSPSEARLDVGGATIVGDGVSMGRVIVTGRELLFRVALPADARLVWEPVGRRGVSEYVSAHDLDPAITYTDGVFALALLFIVVGAVVFALRHRLRACPRPMLLAAFGVCALALVTRLLGLDAQGRVDLKRSRHRRRCAARRWCGCRSRWSRRSRRSGPCGRGCGFARSSHFASR